MGVMNANVAFASDRQLALRVREELDYRKAVETVQEMDARMRECEGAYDTGEA